MHWLTRMTIPLAFALLPGLSQALTVGPGIDIKSALGQPFHGRVKLSDLRDLTVDDIKATLGTDADFQRMGLDGTIYYAPDLAFKVVVNADGDSYIDVSTSKPVNEPLMDFVLHVSWPNNDRLNDIAVMLDPQK